MMQTSLHVIANAASKDKAKRFRSLYSLFNRVLLEKAYRKLNKDAATGIDDVTWEDYGQNLMDNLIALEERMKQKRYWPQYIKRILIPKSNGKKRPLGISILEDKIVQQLPLTYSTLFTNRYFCLAAMHIGLVAQRNRQCKRLEKN